MLESKSVLWVLDPQIMAHRGWKHSKSNVILDSQLGCSKHIHGNSLKKHETKSSNPGRGSQAWFTKSKPQHCWVWSSKLHNLCVTQKPKTTIWKKKKRNQDYRDSTKGWSKSTRFDAWLPHCLPSTAGSITWEIIWKYSWAPSSVALNQKEKKKGRKRRNEGRQKEGRKGEGNKKGRKEERRRARKIVQWVECLICKWMNWFQSPASCMVPRAQ